MKNDNPKLQEFLLEYKALVDKHQVDIATFPVFVPDEKGEYKIKLQSQPIELPKVEKKEEGIPSPFIPK